MYYKFTNIIKFPSFKWLYYLAVHRNPYIFNRVISNGPRAEVSEIIVPRHPWIIASAGSATSAFLEAPSPAPFPTLAPVMICKKWLPANSLSSIIPSLARAL
jgi:hypothetical protein